MLSFRRSCASHGASLKQGEGINLKGFDGFIFDLDGTVYLGENLIEGADEVIERIRLLDKRLLLISNEPIVMRDRQVRVLLRPCNIRSGTQV